MMISKYAASFTFISEKGRQLDGKLTPQWSLRVGKKWQAVNEWPSFDRKNRRQKSVR